MNAIARYAYAALDRAQQPHQPITASLPEHANENGEFAGLGPVWACAKLGHAGHDYYTCPDCKGNYEHWLRQNISRLKGETE